MSVAQIFTDCSIACWVLSVFRHCMAQLLLAAYYPSCPAKHTVISVHWKADIVLACLSLVHDCFSIATDNISLMVNIFVQIIRVTLEMGIEHMHMRHFVCCVSSNSVRSLDRFGALQHMLINSIIPLHSLSADM